MLLAKHIRNRQFVEYTARKLCLDYDWINYMKEFVKLGMAIDLSFIYNISYKSRINISYKYLV